MKCKQYLLCGNRGKCLCPTTVNVIEQRRFNGSKGCKELYKKTESVFCRGFNGSSVCYCYCCSDRRVTEVATHPNKGVVVAGTKGGSLIVFRATDKVEEVYSCEGKGPGGSILDVAFPCRSNEMLTASLDGTVKLWDLEKWRDRPLSTPLDTEDYMRWFCSVASSPSNGVVVAGTNNGTLTLLDKDYKLISSLKVHKNKINSLDFNKNCPHLLATASLDKKVKIFDIRKLESEGLETIEHCKPVNTATFSRTNGCRLLTSDQHSQLNVFIGPLWNLERTIAHPHRQFQHLTPIRASWHPLLDLIIIGRYPDEKLKTFPFNDLKTIDIFSAETGKLKAELLSSSIKPIITSIAEFEHSGEYLVTGTGSLVVFWRFAKSAIEFTKEGLLSDSVESNRLETERQRLAKKRSKKKT